MDVVFRSAVETDIAEVLDLWDVAAENDSRPADDAAKLAAVIARDPEALELAVVDGRVVGSLISGWDGWRAHLYRLAVHPSVRRQGIGRELLTRAERRLVALGASRIDAMVLDNNELGQSLWIAEGFAKQPEWRRWVRPVG
ncbi:GNAT family N-acetyltransferase [Pseudolysinimonas sp.]|jgi:ribosomal protein S18 acetylase RimI-like enzyme|uniref:GNAT family N-acetyltransferase n=1 Tax=Pseudolysinimonas sp. TaxID=2680009 RepID=UPI003782E694